MKNVMSNGLYVTAEEGKSLSFPYDWKQTFARSFDMSRSSNEAQTVKQFVAEDEDRQMGLEVLILLHEYTFATRSQMERLLKVKGIEDDGRLDKILSRYFDRRLINKFTLSAFPLDKIPDDAFVIYCLDHSARHILNHFYRDDVGTMWKSTNAYRGAELVSKYLTTNEFRLALLDAVKDDLASFEPTVNYSIRSRDIRLSACFQVMRGETPNDYILEVIRESDLPTYWNKKVNDQIYPFVESKFWNKYFRIEPIFIFLTEDLEQGRQAAEIVSLKIDTAHFYIMTDAALAASLDKAPLYRYDEAANKLVKADECLFQAPN